MKKIIFFFLIIISAVFVMSCAKEQAISPAAAEQPAPEQPAVPEAEPSMPEIPAPAAPDALPAAAPAAPVDEEAAKIAGDESQLSALESNADIISKKTIWGKAIEQKKIEETTWFETISCRRYTGPPQGFYNSAGTRKEDKISFTMKNNDDRQFFLGYVKVLERLKNKDKEAEKIPMILRINGNRIKDVKECCGTDVLEPGQTLQCNECRANLRYDEDQKYMRDNTQLSNNLEAVSDFVSTQTVFRCRS